ncbi:MAG: DUF4129 domain-containing protein [Acidimicrobiales bacterium]
MAPAELGRAGPADLPPPSVTGDEVATVIEAILARPEFRPEPEPFLQRIWRVLSERLEELLAQLFSGGRGSVVAWVIVVAAIGGSVAMVALVLRGVRRNPRRVEAELADPRRPPADWRAAAEAHEARGEWKAALRCRYRALVAELGGRGVVDEVPGRTAGEYRDEVAGARPAAAPSFAAATDLFEAAWYGDRPTGPEENRHFRRLTTEVLA